MRHFRLSVAGALLPLVLLLSSVPPAGAAGGGETSPYVVTFRGAGNVDSQVGDLQGRFGFKATFRYAYALRGFAARLTAAQADAVARLPFVAAVEPDGIATIAGTAPVAGGETSPMGVRRVGGATSTVAHTAASVNVAVIDTGVDLSHPDLNVVSGTDCIAPGTTAQDEHGHGTHVSGTIAARNTGSGVIGVAPGTLIYAVRVLDANGSGAWSQVLCGIDWVTANAASKNIKVANMSLGGGYTSYLRTGIQNSSNAGVTYVVAAGNSGANLANYAPSGYPEVLAVTAVGDTNGVGGGGAPAPSCRSGEADDRYASFSNYATTSTDNNHTIAGPGVCILSTTLGGGYADNWSGTSMASPHVAGVVALCVSAGGACAGMSVPNVIQKVRQLAADHAAAAPGDYFTGDPAHPVSGRYYGYMAWIGSDLGSGSPTTGSVAGRITVSGTSTGISGATVSGGGQSTTTNGSGNYTLSNLAPGSVTINASKTGYNGNSTSANVTAGNTTSNVNLALVAQPGSLSGRVTNASGGAAISGATVSFGSNSTTTNGNGDYSFASVTPGSYNVTASATGFNPKTASVTVNPGAVATLNFSLTATGSASAPGAVSLTAAGLGFFRHGIRLTWTAAAPNGSQVTNHQIFRATASAGPYGLIATVGNVLTYTETANPARATSYYRVVAVNGVGPGPNSNTASAYSW